MFPKVKVLSQSASKVMLSSCRPPTFPPTQSAINELIQLIKNLDRETKACLEHTGRYYEPVAPWLSDAGIFFNVINPILIKNFGDDSQHSPKTSKADSKKIVRYTLDRWTKPNPYGSRNKTRNQLKTMNRETVRFLYEPEYYHGEQPHCPAWPDLSGYQ